MKPRLLTPAEARARVAAYPYASDPSLLVTFDAAKWPDDDKARFIDVDDARDLVLQAPLEERERIAETLWGWFSSAEDRDPDADGNGEFMSTVSLTDPRDFGEILDDVDYPSRGGLLQFTP